MTGTDRGGAQAPSLLEVRKLCVNFSAAGQRLPAVVDISFNLAPGETLGLVGESGSGKTASVHALLGLLDGNATVTGSAMYRGEELVGKPEKYLQRVRGREIGMIFQDPQAALNPLHRIGTQIEEAVLVHQTHRDHSAARQQAILLLERVGVPNPASALRRFPHEFSGGMRQRVVVAMAIANQPSLLIADEPTTALDVTIQAHVLRVMQEAQHTLGAAMILITHDLGVVAEVADRVAVMYAGRLVEVDTAATVLTHPRHPYTRALLASLPRLDRRVARLLQIPGQPPELGARPTGCAFHPRCPVGADREVCRTVTPALESLAGGGAVACHFASETAMATVSAADMMVPVPDRQTSRSPEPLLTVEQATKEFVVSQGVFRKSARLLAVADVSLRLAPGETLGIVGESGCGKSTLSRLIVRLLEPNSGRIVVEGEDISHRRRQELRRVWRHVQFVFQDSASSLDPRIAISDSIAEPLRAHGLEPIRPRVAELLAQVGLAASMARRYPHELSGGQRQRVAIARALALRPKILVLDEPVSALDASVQAQVLNLLADLQRELGLAYVLVSHNLGVIRQVAHRVAVMYLGRIVEEGPIDAVFAWPRHPYTRALLSAIPSIERRFAVPLGPAARGRRVLLAGDLPDPSNPPSGCHFRTRCWKAQELCAQSSPLLASLAPEHLAACHFPESAPPASDAYAAALTGSGGV